MSDSWKLFLKPEEEARLAEISEMHLKAREAAGERLKIIGRCRKRARAAAREA